MVMVAQQSHLSSIWMNRQENVARCEEACAAAKQEVEARDGRQTDYGRETRRVDHQGLRRPKLPVQPFPGRCGHETAAEGVGSCWVLSVRLHSLHGIALISCVSPL